MTDKEDKQLFSIFSIEINDFSRVPLFFFCKFRNLFSEQKFIFIGFDDFHLILFLFFL